MRNIGSLLITSNPDDAPARPPRVRAEWDEVLRELSSLGLTNEASMGVLMVLTRREPTAAATYTEEW